ncbi:MAG: tetratricopeptide repeat protein [Acidobacteriota bacterium]
MSWSVCLAWAAHAAAAPEDAATAVTAGMAAYEKGDYDAAIAALQKPAGAGDRDALFILGESVFLHTARPGNFAQAYKLYQLGAAAKDPRAEFRLAELRAIGIGEAPDIDASLAWLRRASDAEFPPAQLMRTQLFKARTQARESAALIDGAALDGVTDPTFAGIDGAQFGLGPQAQCTQAKEAALLSQVGNQLYGRFVDELILSYYSKLPDQVVARPLLAPFYAHVIASDPSLFRSCSVATGLPPDAVTTGARIPAFDLTELKTGRDGTERRGWLLPNQIDVAGARLGVQGGPAYFNTNAGSVWGCPREASEQIVHATARPATLPSCVALQAGTVATTGRSLKVSEAQPHGFGGARLLPEVVIFGQFGKVFYLHRAQPSKAD